MSVSGDTVWLRHHFKIDALGNETVQYSFNVRPDGQYPYAAVVRSGNLYGTTAYGAANGNGSVFKLDRNGKETLLHSFGGANDGKNPFRPLILDAASNLYGITQTGGAHNFGIVFKIAPNGTETILHSFAGGSDGARRRCLRWRHSISVGHERERDRSVKLCRHSGWRDSFLRHSARWSWQSLRHNQCGRCARYRNHIQD